MAAGEDHAQLVVLQCGHVEVDVVAHGLMREIGSMCGGHAVLTEPVERLAPRCGGEPGARTVRHAAAVPLDCRGDERVLDGVLGEREVAAEPARDGGEHSGPLVAERLLERPHVSSSPSIGVISIEPYFAAGVFAAQAIAASRSSTSRM